MSELKRQLTLRDGIPLAVGSIIGSGVLFLPSLIYSISGTNTLWVWIITTVLCFPLLAIFSNMVSQVPNESGVEGFVSLGLGKSLGASIPVLFLGTVCIGMPASALIVGEYVRNLVGGGQSVQWMTAILVIVLGVGSNLIGVRLGSLIQSIVAGALFIVGAGLFAFTAPEAAPHYPALFSSFDLPAILPGIVVAFWAYAGFENLTFIAGEFKRPERDFRLSLFIALIVCGALYLVLSANFASLVPQNEVNPVAGLYQLAERLPGGIIAPLLITLFAFLAVQINFNSWIWGISRLIYSSAKQNKMPVAFATLDSRGIPTKAVGLLASLFLVSIFISIFFPNLLETALVAVSTNFVFIYVLCMISYLFSPGTRAKKAMALGLLVALIPALLSSGWLVAYPLGLLLVSSLRYHRLKPVEVKPC